MGTEAKLAGGACQATRWASRYLPFVAVGLRPKAGLCFQQLVALGLL